MNYLKIILDKFISSYPDPDILGEKEPENEEEILNFLKKYANYIKKPKVYAGVQEIALTSFFFRNKYKCIDN